MTSSHPFHTASVSFISRQIELRPRMAMVMAWCRKRSRIAPAVGTSLKSLPPVFQRTVAGHDGGAVFVTAHDYSQELKLYLETYVLFEPPLAKARTPTSSCQPSAVPPTGEDRWTSSARFCGRHSASALRGIA